MELRYRYGKTFDYLHQVPIKFNLKLRYSNRMLELVSLLITKKPARIPIFKRRCLVRRSLRLFAGYL